MKTCSVDGCDRRNHAKGLCSLHYGRDDATKARRAKWYQENKERIRAKAREEGKLYLPEGTKPIPTGKICRKCGGGNLISTGPQGRWFRCRDCKKESNRNWNRKNPERRAVNKNRDYIKHKEKRIETQKIWRKNNPCKMAALIKKRNDRICGELTDAYVRGQLVSYFGVKNPPQELIELKRVQLQIHRALKHEHQQTD